jgi:TolB-like protein
MDKPFPAYKGDQEYLFVSYSHSDEDIVFPELEYLHGMGINIWYDEGISPGSRWSDALANALMGASHFLLFVTPNSANSQNCLDEIGFALEKEKPLLAIHLQQTELPAGLSLRLGSRQAVMKHDLTDDLYRNKLAETLGGYIVKQEPVVEAAPERNMLDADRIFSSMAILPFENRSDDPELTTLGEVIGEEVLHLISNIINGQRVVGGRETRQYANRDTSASEIARELNVGFVVTGNIRKMGERVRITAELFNEEGAQLWNHRFDATAMDDLYDREDRIVDLIAGGVNVGSEAFCNQRAFEIPEEELGPWGLFFKADATYRMGTGEHYIRGVELARRAMELDPNEPTFAGGCAFWLGSNVMQGFSKDREKDAADALRLGEIAARSNKTYPLFMAAHTFGFLGDHARSIALARRAYDMASRWVPLKNVYAMRLMYSGDARSALDVYMEAEEVRLPGQGSQAQNIGQCHVILGELDEAATWIRQAVDQGITPHISLSAYANVLAQLGRIDEALSSIEKIKGIIPGFTIRSSINAYRRAFGNEEARERLTAGLNTLLDLGYE